MNYDLKRQSNSWFFNCTVIVNVFITLKSDVQLYQTYKHYIRHSIRVTFTTRLNNYKTI